jgi:hypothetical protein
VSNELVIGFDYQNLIKQFRNLRKAKDFLATVNTGPIEAGWINYNYRYSSLDGGVEQVCFTLEGEGPFYLLGNRTLRYIMATHPDFKFPKIGDIIWVGDFRLKIIDNHQGWPYTFLVMFPDTLSILIYAILPFVRWFDLIYRRLILTASVWNLARCRVEEWPHWGHLKWSKEYRKTKEEE